MRCAAIIVFSSILASCAGGQTSAELGEKANSMEFPASCVAAARYMVSVNTGPAATYAEAIEAGWVVLLSNHPAGEEAVTARIEYSHNLFQTFNGAGASVLFTKCADDDVFGEYKRIFEARVSAAVEGEGA